MARVSFDTFQQTAAQSDGGSNDGIGFFSLKNDGDEAVVRILHDSPDTFDIVATHTVQIGERYRKVSCLRNPGDAVECCPLCKTGAKLGYRFFVHMLQYGKDEQGKVTVKPVVWDRSAKQMSQKLVTMIQEYGPLSDCVFKVRRNGKSGDKDTTYEILFANPSVYRPDLYPKDDKAFENYNTMGSKVLDKTFEEVSEFVATGSFPARGGNRNNSTAPATPVTPATNYQAPVVPSANEEALTTGPSGYGAPASRPPFDGGTYVGNSGMSSGAPNRPNRYY